MWFIGVEVEQETSAPPPNKFLDPSLQNNGKEKQKACCTCKFVFFFIWLIRKKSVLHVQFVFLLIRSIDLDAIFIALPV